MLTDKRFCCFAFLYSQMALISTTCKRLGLLSLRAIATNSSSSTFATKSTENSSSSEIVLPKRPIASAYSIYFRNHIKAIKEKNPSVIHVTQLAAIASKGWGALSAEEKAEYAKQHAAEMEAFRKSMADFQERAKCNPAMKKALEEFELKRQLVNVKGRIKKCVKKLNMAGLPTKNRKEKVGGQQSKALIPVMKLNLCRPHHLFLADFFSKAMPAGSQTNQKSDPSVAKKTLMYQNFKQVTSEAHKQWDSLDESARKEYEIKAKAYNDKLKALKLENKELLDKYKDLMKELKRIEAILIEAEKKP